MLRVGLSALLNRAALARQLPQVVASRLFATSLPAASEEHKLPARERLEFDLCIVGAGPAGLSAAIRFKQVRHMRAIQQFKTLKSSALQHCSVSCQHARLLALPAQPAVSTSLLLLPLCPISAVSLAMQPLRYISPVLSL